MKHLPRRPYLINVEILFGRFESEELRRLAIFVETVGKVGRSRLMEVAGELGTAPKVDIHRHAKPGRRGEGVIRTRVATPETREAIWLALRKLRTETNPCSTSAARNVLAKRAHEASEAHPHRPGVAELVLWLKAFKKVIKKLESGQALVGGTVRQEVGPRREYQSRGQVLDLAQNAEAFHDDLGKRDDFDQVIPLLEPAVDHALIEHARAAFELADIAEAVLAEPALVRR